MKSNSKWGKIFDWLEKAFKSITRYVKSSILSLVIIAIMFFLLTKMGQASAMVVDLVEEDWLAFLFSVILVNALAFSLSHYPIYNYYATKLNDKHKIFRWNTEKVFRFVPVNVFYMKSDDDQNHDGSRSANNKYPYDLLAHLLRYFTGFMVFASWNYVVIFGYETNLTFEGYSVATYEIVALIVFLLAHFVLYGIIKHRRYDLQWKIEQAKENGEETEDLQKTWNKRNFRLTLSLLIIAKLLIFFVVWVMFLISSTGHSAFSKAGLLLILIINFLCLLVYYNFRLIRSDLDEIHKQLKKQGKGWLSWFTYCLKGFWKSENYLGLLFVFFLFSLGFIIYCHVATIQNSEIVNGIPILLAYLYFYSYSIAITLKYYFVTSKDFKGRHGKDFNITKKVKRRRLISAAMVAVVLMMVIDMVKGTEIHVHQLPQVDQIPLEDQLTDDQLISDIKGKDESTVFFIAAQGGGLKANFWTLNILNYLQDTTDGQFLDQTVAMSGASGGSLGLGLYTALFKEHQRDTRAIQKKIDEIAEQNYTSMDLTLTFGWDFFRTVPPFKYLTGHRNRTFYSQVKYQNIITGGSEIELDSTPYRELWNGAYQAGGYFPSLIMNTGSVKGSRGIFWSHYVSDEQFHLIYPFSENLADLRDNQTIPYYWAISTTNRFPLFSPSAKIKGKGHYIDVGAVENSGLLGCMNLHEHMERDSAFQKKKVVFVEIVNGKSKYIKYLLNKFAKRYPEVKPYWPYDEDETNTISADASTGLNLDKFPEYLADYMVNWDSLDENIEYVEIPLPHRISVDDVEGYLKGKIEDGDLKKKLQNFLNEENQTIVDVMEAHKVQNDFWEYYELTLSRHLCRSNINFGKAMLGLRKPGEGKKHYLLEQRFDKILKHF